MEHEAAALDSSLTDLEAGKTHLEHFNALISLSQQVRVRLRRAVLCRQPAVPSRLQLALRSHCDLISMIRRVASKLYHTLHQPLLHQFEGYTGARYVHSHLENTDQHEHSVPPAG